MTRSRGRQTGVGVVAVATVFSAILAAPASAQSTGGTAKQLVAGLVANRIADPRTGPGAAARTQVLVDEISKSVARGIATAPIGGSSAGFTYEFNAQTGERTLRSQSFGPLFVERALTNGRGVFNAGASFTRTTFDTLLDVDLKERGLLLFNNRVRFRDNNFEQFIEEYLTIEPTVSTLNVHASYGVTSGLDLGVIVPVSSVTVKARRYWDYDVSRTYAVTPSDRAFFPTPAGKNFDPPLNVPNRGQVSASGVGDVTLRAKYGFGPSGTQRAAFIVDTRLPTGDADNFLGSGKASTRAGFAATGSLSSSVAVHVTGGYRTGGLADEADYGLALDAALLSSRKLTASVELFGQYAKDSVSAFDEFKVGPLDVQQPLGAVTVPAQYSAAEPTLLLGSVNQLRGAAAFKYNLAGTALLTGGVLFPLNKAGLTSPLTVFVGLDLAISGR